MTNGRAHGLLGGGSNSRGSGGLAGSSLASATTPASSVPTTTLTIATTTPRAYSRGIDRGRGSVVYNANANANDYDGDADGRDGGAGDEGDGDADGEREREREREDASAEGGGRADESDEDKVAYVVEGRNYRKYRVEEKTDDGFIVGEYGVVDHNDGNLSGVRYTADSTIDRSLIQKGLLTFLKLK